MAIKISRGRGWQLRVFAEREPSSHWLSIACRRFGVVFIRAGKPLIPCACGERRDVASCFPDDCCLNMEVES